jgi:hypothetical protein
VIASKVTMVTYSNENSREPLTYMYMYEREILLTWILVAAENFCTALQGCFYSVSRYLGQTAENF